MLKYLAATARRAVIALACALALVAGSITVANAANTYTLSGHVNLGTAATAAGLNEVQVIASRINGAGGGNAYTDAQGNYSLPGLEEGTYTVQFAYRGSGGFATQFWGNQPVGNNDTPIVVPGTGTTGKNIILPLKTAISGQVTLGSPAVTASSNVEVRWSKADGWGNWSSSSDDKQTVGADGTYSLSLDPGNYKLTFYSMTDAFQSRVSQILTLQSSGNLANQNINLPLYGSISGHVTLGSPGTPAGAGTVRVTRHVFGFSGGEPSTLVDASGFYSFPKLPDGSDYYLAFTHLPGDFKPVDQVSGIDIRRIVLNEANRNPDVSITLKPANSISGTVLLGSTTPAGAGEVRVTVDGGWGATNVLTDAAGRFSVPRLVDGYYRVQFTYLGSGGFANAWWRHGIDRDSAEPVSVWDSVTLADMVLPQAVSISGRVTLPNTQPVADAEVILIGPGRLTVDTDSAGNYAATGLYPGEYQIEAYRGGVPPVPTYRQFWGASASSYRGSLDLNAGEAASNVDIQFVDRASASGTATCAICALEGIQWAHPFYGLETQVDGKWVDANVDWMASGNVGANFSFGNLFPGQYRVTGKFADELGPTWGIGFGSSFTVAAGQNLPGLTVHMTRPVTTRLEGSDRFETAVATSKAGFADGADVVFIASGLNFPDALGAGPAAAMAGGPLLLVQPGGVPPVVLDELERLAPSRVVIVGGPASVSTAVESQLNQLDSLDEPVVRLSGVSRYSTSLAIARYAFSDSGADVAYVATGSNFPDALAAGPAAASRQAPVILVPGTGTAIDADTRDVLLELGVTTVYIAGGPGVVSASMAASIESLPGVTVERLGGSDRYETGVLVNSSGQFESDEIFFAVGTNYPDALAGGALAGVLSAPLFVVPHACLTSTLEVSVLNYMPYQVVLLGGTGALAAPEQLFTRC